MYKRQSCRKLILVAVFLISIAATAAAFTFMPMSITISPSGANSIASFRITNDSSQQIAITIKAMMREIDENGNETNKPADNLFAIFPTRVVVQPNSFQNIKVQYKGNPSLSREVAYRIIAEQVPIDFSQQQTSGVKVMFRYIAALYVAPPNVSHKVSVTKVEYGEQESKKGFFVTITNSGTRHAIINDPVMKISGSSFTITLKDESVSAINGQNLLAGNVRKFFIPCEDAVPGKNYTGTLTATIE
ncbi:MAG: fimbria/pilus periplasmic chaperone [Spirochaetota bacterium]|jgi:fimbrial chaperone protein|nr:fimbria/pilus periplasmic chaperone [Spirochaetota bacterium]HPY05176.1 fimbria/pilus periplasmic chaperone [Rectinema sp.]